MKMYIAGKWIDKAQTIDVTNPFDGSVIDTVPRGEPSDVEAAIDSAERGAKAMAALSAYERYQVIHRAADLMLERLDDLGRTITLEEGKILAEGMGEAARAAETIVLSAEEAKRLTGETLDLSGSSAGAGKFGFTLRVPCGVVAAITPFNFPLNLVCHKVGPALAAGNAIIIKPASDTPLSALKLTEIFVDAGLPEEAIQCVTGSGGIIGDAISSNPKVRKISFTGSRDVGEHICQVAGLKKVTMELGSNAPLIIMPDADLEKVAAATVSSGFATAGQVCEALTTGEPLDEGVNMGPMIRTQDAERVDRWVQEAVSSGASIVTGGTREGTIYAPTILADVAPEMKVACDEIFGPALGVSRIDGIDQAITMANDTNYGLSAAIFTENLNWALKFAQQVESGNIHVNWGTQWRADLMPYGGLKESGMGKEGPKYAVEEMTETKMVVIH